MADSSYEELRLLNIARNNAILSALDIPVNAFSPVPQSAPSKKSRARPSRNDEERPATRTSMRLAQNKEAAPALALPADWEEPDEKDRRKKKVRGNKAKYQVESETADVSDGGAAAGENSASLSDLNVVKQQILPKGTADSSRNLTAQVALLRPILGERVPGGSIKAGVMQFVSPSCEPKFSKYTGVQEWRNAIFFMLNVAAGNGYSNTFRESAGGAELRVSYFLSDRTRPDAPVIQRIVRSAVRDLDADADAGAPAPPTLHLFCRPGPGLAGKPGAAGAGGVDSADYVYFGRLRYLRHDAAAVPIEFEFRLEDFQLVKQRAPCRQLILLAQA